MIQNGRKSFDPFSSISEVKEESEFNRRSREFFANIIDRHLLVTEKCPEHDLKVSYRRVFETSLSISLLLMLLLAQSARLVSVAPAEIKSAEVIIEVAEIPPTEYPRNMPAPPSRPTVPIPTESELVPEDVTISTTNLDFDLSEIPPPPPPSENDGIEAEYAFIPYDEPPVPIGGSRAINKYLIYPEIARRAGIEAVVIVGVLVDEKGNSVKTQILKHSGTNIGFEEAAEAAAMQLRWKPAKQRDRAIKVWVSIPIRFELKEQSPVSSSRNWSILSAIASSR